MVIAGRVRGMFCKVKVAPQKAVLGRKLEIPKYSENVQA
jgi:hypothetical protein